MSDQLDVHILTGDGKHIIALKEVLAPCSKTLRDLMQDVPITSPEEPIPLPNITAPLLERVYAYCREHHTDVAPAPPLPDADAIVPMPPAERTWDAEFVAEADMAALINLTQAANYLDIAGLMELCTRTVAARLLGKKVEEVFRAMGAQPQEITPELEARLTKENEWLVGQ